MVWRQTTLSSWLLRLHGSTATNPIEIMDDDTDDADAEDARPSRGNAANPIDISDGEDTEPLRSQTEATAAQTSEQIGENGGMPPEQIALHWPPRVPYWDCSRNPRRVQFTNLDLGKCRCSHVCSRHSCDNAKTSVYCDDTNCDSGPSCGNRLEDWMSLVLRPCIKGLGVVTTADIPKGTVLGEYCGLIIPEKELTKEQIGGGFVLEFRSSTTTGDAAYIDARPGGSLCRFVNHSCSPNSRFDEFALRTTRKMVITARKRIRAGEEITVRYSAKVPFDCLCGEDRCVSRRP